MLLMMVIKNPVLIYDTMTLVNYSTQKQILLYLSCISLQSFWNPLPKSADSSFLWWKNHRI